MSEQITAILKSKLDDLSTYKNIDEETRRNALKEELQFYILNFIYHHPKYNKWIMYGGSALRIIHGLDRMSVDLDFEISQKMTDKFLKELKKEIEDYFANTYNADSDFLTIKITTNRGLLLKFHVGKKLSLNNSSDQVHVKIDLNHFVALGAVTERRPINHEQFSFVILTYNMGTLMASKIAAIFLRGSRGVGKIIYGEKGRDIYDLLWYMDKKIVPDFDYLTAKNINTKDPKDLFDKLTIQMNKVNDKNLEQDLEPLFANKNFIINWLSNWRENYFHLLNDYRINTVTTLNEMEIIQHLSPNDFSFTYTYNTEDEKTVQIRYLINDYWIIFKDGKLSLPINNEVKNLAKFDNSVINISAATKKSLLQYATLFYEKTEKYFEKTNRIVLGNAIITKVIRATTNNFNQKEQIVLNKSVLLSCELDDLLR
jgi:hypothetical protein